MVNTTVRAEPICIYGTATVTAGARHGYDLITAVPSLTPEFVRTVQDAVGSAERGNIDETRQLLGQLRGYNFSLRLRGVAGLSREIMRTAEGKLVHYDID
ncbi:MAG: hypothetical protein HYT72_02955 [Candidatus Aenigmarchaeota archaeon]|nr:hypothetical protein [Candidatus Aenigmarchaeota archaeon]